MHALSATRVRCLMRWRSTTPLRRAFGQSGPGVRKSSELRRPGSVLPRIVWAMKTIGTVKVVAFAASAAVDATTRIAQARVVGGEHTRPHAEARQNSPGT